MDSFKFRCITVAKTDVSNGIFIKAINKNGPFEFFVYGKKQSVDSMSLIEIAGIIKNRQKDYLVAKEINIINRYNHIRGSFELLSCALIIMEIAYKTKCPFELTLKTLDMLKNQKGLLALLWFLSNFLAENGILNPQKYSKQELSIMNFIKKAEEIRALKIKETEIILLIKKIFADIENYANIKFSNTNLIRRIAI